MGTSLPASAERISGVEIEIGSEKYLVDVDKIPYFKSFLSFQEKSGQNTGSLPVHGDIPFFNIINTGARNGFRQFFRLMPVSLSDYHTLCETLDFLTVDVLEGRNLRDIMKTMQQGKPDWDPEERRAIAGNKSIPRDAAFALLYSFLMSEFKSDAKDSSMAFDVTLFVVSHPRTFRHRTRQMVRQAFEERFLASEKQRKGLDKWPIDFLSSGTSLESDVTTEEDYDDDMYYGSDWSY
ncbi:hypothetical protein HD806DRAFT_515782 [Xylariaceae sp. AK1471]|nr:hypothetical protein HD806DRAFT_515782 [Xylariaceae sp. AK1471]